jgi:hypothetical protein
VSCLDGVYTTSPSMFSILRSPRINSILFMQLVCAISDSSIYDVATNLAELHLNDVGLNVRSAPASPTLALFPSPEIPST